MSKRNRIFIAVLLIYAAGTAFLLYRVLADLDPRYRESAEESLVETSQLVAALVEQDVRDGAIDVARLDPLFRSLYARKFEAKIFSVTKRRVEVRVAVTDGTGRVLYDSLGRATGSDYSRWRDVALALRGEYGARSTLDVEGDPATAVMYVSAPVRWQERIVGAVSVGKPVQSFGQFVEDARRKTIYVGVFSAIAVLVLAFIMSVWLVRPFGLIADYVRYVRAQPRISLPGMGRRALGVIGAAYEEMRDALAGRNYVADYVQTLTHEVKSPLSAIRGAAELLQEAGMPPGERQKFLANIMREAGRIQEMVDRMMELTALETRRALEHVATVPLNPLLEEAVAAAGDAGAQRDVTVRLEAGDEASVEGDAFLVRRAFSNLLDNAIDFSPSGGEVTVTLARQGRKAVVQVRDRGPGIPEYAVDKVFEKFYSLARPHSRKKSTGLGLSFVREIASLHHGRIDLANAEGGGAVATLTLPLAPA
ncbi:two-component system sensor histidine kinase CreC [Ramlibacter sp. PS4R-6]|uniref:two-component system sensor histidine kinase CreC n=1 Tax=Ramlibacter sp. PS4R-6 TaxID=3133438 RepID=UPI0030B72329